MKRNHVLDESNYFIQTIMIIYFQVSEKFKNSHLILFHMYNYFNCKLKGEGVK